jgi:hypothetical protein
MGLEDRMRESRAGRTRRSAVPLVVLFAAAVLLTVPSAALANGGEQPVPAARPDFLLGRPRGFIGVRGSWLMPRAQGDLFDFVGEQLTIERRDFQAPAITGEVGFAISPRFTILGGVEYGGRSVQSEYRHFTDNRGLPINQTTKLSQANLTGSVRVALVEPGRSISRLAFIPRTFTPYVGAGAGFFFYDLRQTGDFVDFATLRVFTDRFTSQGWSPSAHLLGGTDIRMWRTLFLDVEARYVWSHAGLDADFVGFDGIDLAGARISTGIRVVF